MINSLLNRYLRMLILSFMAIASLAGCVTVEDNAAQPLRTTIVMAGDLSGLSTSATTFSWHPELHRIITDKRLDPQQVSQHMQDVLKRTLQAKGYRFVEDPQLADFQVGFGVAMGTKMSDAQILAVAGLVAGLSTEGVNTQKYDKGTVLIALFKPIGVQGGNDLVWRVLAQGFGNVEKIDELTTNFDSLIDSMLTNLPLVNVTP
ncbi:hypothetical protein C9I43_09205 [Shewanella morhuae]|uniref:DUF4136 domain-containing protein n=1 Tax=Shewanella morhuae TaxID=365591 RepID=A0ABX5HUV1_9GAMM|nr:DUF4136 domain-containing protein [Shewanella morhuae]PTA50663.1 hypothetical protein C9I43_09205 [Shewanella morhuae]